MSPIRMLCKTAPIWSCALAMAILLPWVAPGQSLTPEKLWHVREQLHGKIADTTRVRLLLALSGHASENAGRTTARDSALQFANDALALSAKIHYDSGIYKAYLQEILVWANAREHMRRQNQDATKALENKRAVQDRFIAFVQKYGSADQVGQAYLDVCAQSEFFVDGAQEYDSAAAYFQKSGNAQKQSEALYGLGCSYVMLKKLKEALPLFHRSMSLAEPTGGKNLYNAYGMLGNTYNSLGGYNTALKYEIKALRLAEAAGDTTYNTGKLHIFLGLLYSRLKDYASAREHNEKAYRIYKNYTAEIPGDFVSCAVNLANNMILTDQPQQSIDFLKKFDREYKSILTPNHSALITMRFMTAYTRLHDFATAQKYCNELMISANKMTQPWLAYLSITSFLVESKQYHAAEKYLAETERILKTEKRISDLPVIYSRWFKVDSAKGDYVRAIEMLKLSKAYSDSVLNDTKAKEIALLEIEYETEKKEQSIALLTKDSELGRQQLAQSRFQNNAVLVGLAVAVLISGLLYQQYRTKKRNNTELTLRQQQIETTNGLLQKTLLEKEWLLKEVHHRVKNNLQTVVSLLGSQSYALQNSEAASAIHDSQNRVHAMSLLHQKLYLTEHRTSINMAGYLGELIEYLRDSFPAGRLIQFESHIQPIELDVSQAIPVGLILNEAVTNVIKYAFPNDPKDNCRVVIAMQQDADRHVRLTIADNGKGLAPDFDGSGNDFGMGLRLIHGLTSEIDGTCKISSNGGTGVSIDISFTASALLE